MEKYSVKKPFTVLVAVIAIIVLGIVSVAEMTLDLLPKMNLPYLMVITTYPGASPERVESEVTTLMESSLGTLENIKNVTSVSAENYSMVQLEFEDQTDMDSALVRVSSSVNQLDSSLPDACGTPSLMEISMDMVATMYVGIEHGDDDIYAITDYARNEVIPYLERTEGVASVTSIGLVDQTIQVELDQTKIDDLNTRILARTSEELAKAKKQLDDAQDQVDAGQKALEEQESVFGKTVSSAIFSSVDDRAEEAASGLKDRLNSLSSQISSLASTARDLGSSTSSTISSAMEDAQAARDNAQSKVEAAQAVVDQAQETYDAAVKALEDAGEAADESLTEAVTLAQQALVDAQTDLTTAAGEFSQAAQALQDAATNIQTTIDTSGIVSQLEDLASSASSLASSIDGSSFSSLMSSVTKIASLIPQVQSAVSQLNAVDLSGAASGDISNVTSGISTLSSMLDNVPSLLTGLESGVASLTQGQLDAAVAFSTAATQLYNAQTQLEGARAQYESARTTALANANADQLLSVTTLSQMIYAQNFSMPAGYIDDKEDHSWLLKVGDEFEDATDISEALLCDLDEIGSVRLADVANVTVIDNAEESYMKLNGSQGIAFAIFKSSTASTNTVSGNIAKTFKQLQEKDPDLGVVTLMDQGSYIELIVKDILQSMVLGGLLAIIVLALFLRTVKPTLIVAISIPLSVMFALTLLYFTGLTLNIMTLAGLSLGIGMLVDNSIVVLENIFRLRMRGVPSARAAVQGTKQVSGAIMASTLTTVGVFFPIVFASGTVRSLVVPLALSITYCLMASLLVALTVVPAASSSILKNVDVKEGETSRKIQEKYAQALRWCLQKKALVLGVAGALLVLCIVRLVTMGIVYFPDMNGNAAQVTLVTDENLTRTASYLQADELTQRILQIDGVEEVGVMDSGSTAGFLGQSMSSGSSYGSYVFYVTPNARKWGSRMKKFTEEIEAKTDGIKGEVTVSSSGMGDMTAMMSSGLSIGIYGNDLAQLASVSEEVMDIVKEQEGFENVSNGLEESDATLHLVIDRDKAMESGFTVAQIYASIAQRLTTSVKSTKITVNGVEMDVVIKDATNELTRENILDMEFKETSMAGAMTGTSSGASAGFSAGSGSGSMSAMAAFTGGTDSDGSGDDTDSDSDDSEDDVHTLGEFASLEETTTPSSVRRENLKRYVTVTASTAEGYNTTLLSRTLSEKLAAYEAPDGVTVKLQGETTQVSDMITQMSKMLALAMLLIYLIMVAQFQSLLSPFIVMLTIPLAFTGGMLALILTGQQLSLLALMGFLILVGTVVNNGIVFVDYTNQLRMGGMAREDALVATGMTRMRPILMTAMTTILAMVKLIFGNEMGSQMGRSMALVIAGGLLYATLMTLFVVPVFYDILFKRPPLTIDVGDDIDDAPDDAAEFIEKMKREKEE